jgi:mannitol/fructose-specific phosphotransferase system IIA component (Ntr-type)
MVNICNANVVDQVQSWEAAIRLAAQPLLEAGCIATSYIDAMIQNVNDNGSYMIILPGISMPHARPESGALKNGLSILKVNAAVTFPGKNLVNVLFCFSGVDPDGHMDMIADLSEILMDDVAVARLFAAKTGEDIFEVFHG